MTYLLVLTVGLIAGTISGIVGFGSSIMLMPVLVIAFSPREAVPIMAVAAIMTVVGAVIGFLTGIVVSTGPINTPFFLAYGLIKGAFLGTEAMASLAVYISKSLVFRSYGALPLSAIVQGLIIGCSLTAGSFIAKRFVLSLEPEKFRLLMDAVLLVSGLTMLWAAFK